MATQEFANVPDSPSELLAWIASTLEGYDETAVTNVSTALQRRLTKSRLARCSREAFVCLLSGTFDETTARDIAVDLHQSIHAGAGQSSQATERLNGNFLWPPFW